MTKVAGPDSINGWEIRFDVEGGRKLYVTLNRFCSLYLRKLPHNEVGQTLSAKTGGIMHPLLRWRDTVLSLRLRGGSSKTVEAAIACIVAFLYYSSPSLEGTPLSPGIDRALI